MHIDITTFDIWLLHPELWFTAVFENGPNQKKNKKITSSRCLRYICQYIKVKKITLLTIDILIVSDRFGSVEQNNFD